MRTKSPFWPVLGGNREREVVDERPLGDLDAEQPLRTQRKSDVVSDRIEIILPIRPADDLIVLAVLSDLLEAAMQIADVGDAADYGLAVELQYEPQDSVRRWVLWSDVDEHVLTFEIGLDTRRRFDGYRCAAVVRHERNTLRPAL